MTLLGRFLTAPVSQGGFGWSQPDTLKTYGVIIAAMQVLPVVGGAISDRTIGPEKALRYGAILMLLGHFALVAPHALPFVWERFDPSFDAQVFLDTQARLEIAKASSWVETLIVVSFFGAVTLVALGNALFKPNISAVLGRLPFADRASRDAAFSLFHMFVNIGGLLAIVIGGWVTAQFGYGSAFTLAGFGMLAGLWLLQRYAPRYIRPVAGGEHTASPERETGPHPAEKEGWRLPCAIILATVVIFGMILFQIMGTLNLYAVERVSSQIFGVAFPVIWILSMNPIVMLIVMPPLAKAWREGRGPGRDWSMSAKACFGFAMMTLAFGLLYAAETQAGEAAVPAIVLASAIVLISLAELFVGPTAMSAITRIVPSRHSALAVGSFYGALGVGGFLSGQIGAGAAEFGYASVFVALAGVCALSAIFYLGARLPMKRVGL